MNHSPAFGLDKLYTTPIEIKSFKMPIVRAGCTVKLLSSLSREAKMVGATENIGAILGSPLLGVK